jgi:exopolysaccharide biosynthesis polyprenyl glycosylphosphotransferase
VAHGVAAERDQADPAAAGNDETIPRTFLGLMDLSVLGLAFLAARVVAPMVQHLLLPSEWLQAFPVKLGLPKAPTTDFPSLSSVAWVFAATAPTTLVCMELLGGYKQLADQSFSRLVASTTLSAAIAISFTSMIVFALKMSGSSRVVIFTYGSLSALALLTYRAALRGYKRHRLATGIYAKNVLLVGQPAAVSWMTRHFQESVPRTRFRISGWLEARPPLVSQLPTPGSDVPVERLGQAEDIGPLLINRPVHEVIAIQSSSDRDWLLRVIEACDYFRVRLRIVPEALLVGNLHDLRLVFRGDPLKLPEVVLAPPHLESDALFIKRIMDVVLSAFLMVLLSPVFLLVAIAIKITTPKLPVFYQWRVVGLKGRPFVGYKFTTMVADAESQRSKLLDRNEMQGPVFKVKDDPRMTPCGRFLRKFSLNELPQLWSVFKGDMSLVGPRPAFRHELERYEMWQKRKLCVKPGITCLWQVSGRNRINNFDDWVRLDLEYIDRWSLWLDLRILMRTAWAVVAGTGS